MKRPEALSTQPGVLAVIYGFSTHIPLVEVLDADRATTAEVQMPRRPGAEPKANDPLTELDFDTALAGLGYVRTSTWRHQRGLAFCDVTTAHT